MFLPLTSTKHKVDRAKEETAGCICRFGEGRNPGPRKGVEKRLDRRTQRHRAFWFVNHAGIKLQLSDPSRVSLTTPRTAGKQHQVPAVGEGVAGCKEGEDTVKGHRYQTSDMDAGSQERTINHVYIILLLSPSPLQIRCCCQHSAGWAMLG